MARHCLGRGFRRSCREPRSRRSGTWGFAGGSRSSAACWSVSTRIGPRMPRDKAQSPRRPAWSATWGSQRNQGGPSFLPSSIGAPGAARREFRTAGGRQTGRAIVTSAKRERAELAARPQSVSSRTIARIRLRAIARVREEVPDHWRGDQPDTGALPYSDRSQKSGCHALER